MCYCIYECTYLSIYICPVAHRSNRTPFLLNSSQKTSFPYIFFIANLLLTFCAFSSTNWQFLLENHTPFRETTGFQWNFPRYVVHCCFQSCCLCCCCRCNVSFIINYEFSYYGYVGWGQTIFDLSAAQLDWDYWIRKNCARGRIKYLLVFVDTSAKIISSPNNKVVNSKLASGKFFVLYF